MGKIAIMIVLLTSSLFCELRMVIYDGWTANDDKVAFRLFEDKKEIAAATYVNEKIVVLSGNIKDGEYFLYNESGKSNLSFTFKDGLMRSQNNTFAGGSYNMTEFSYFDNRPGVAVSTKNRNFYGELEEVKTYNDKKELISKKIYKNGKELPKDEQNSIFTKGNLAALRSAVVIYYSEKEGVWPEDLTTSFQQYSYPLPKEEFTGSDKVVTKKDGKGGWFYVTDNTSVYAGNVFLNLEGKDVKGVPFSCY